MEISQKGIKNGTKIIRVLHAIEAYLFKSSKVKFFLGVFLILQLLVGIIVLFNLSLISSHIKPDEVKAATQSNWYNSSWKYRQSAAINGSSSGAQNNYQVKINVTYNPHMKFDFSDIRFTSADGFTLLSYWLESYIPSGSAVFWVKVPVIPASPSATNLYIYYGNSAAATISSGENTFNFFDHFEPKSWQKIKNLPKPHADQAGAVLNGKVYTIGGYDIFYLQPVGLVWEYDPLNDTYIRRKSLNVARWGLACTGYGGNIYCFGGFNASQSANLPTEKYNPATDTWTNLSSLPGALQGQGLTAVANGNNIFLFYNRNLYKYDPATDNYTSLSTGPQNIVNWPSMAYYNNEIYILGGYYDGNGKNYVQIYNMANNTWRQGAPMPVGLYGTLRENPVVNGKIYILQGQSVSSRGDFFSRYLVYNISNDSWTWGELGYWDADGVSGGVIDNKIYTFGGRRGHGADDRGTDFAGVLDTTKNITNKWIDVSSGGWREDNSALTTGLLQFNNYSQIRTANTVTNGKAKIISRMKYTGAGKTGYGGLLVNSRGGLYYDTDNSYAAPYLDVVSNQNRLFRMTGKNPSVSTHDSPVVSADVWHNYVTTFDTSKITETRDGSSALSINDSAYRNGYIQVFRTSNNNSAGDLNLAVDYIAVANYVSPEPTPGIFGQEEVYNSTPPPGPPCAEWGTGAQAGVCLKVATSLFQGPNKKQGDISTSPAEFIVRILTIVLSFIGGIALLLIISAGYKIITSKGKPEGVQQGREQLLSAIVGLVFIIFSFVIFQLVVTDILKIPGITK